MTAAAPEPIRPDPARSQPARPMLQQPIAAFFTSPWLWMWAIVLGTAALGGLALPALIQSWGVLLLRLGWRDAGRLPAICLIGLMSFGFVPLGDARFFIDIPMLLSGVMLYRFAEDPPTAIRALRHARITALDRIAFVTLAILGLSAAEELGMIQYHFDLTLFWGLILIAIMAFRGEWRLLVLTATLGTLAHVLGLSLPVVDASFPERFEGVTLPLGASPLMPIAMAVVGLLVIGLRFYITAALSFIACGILIATSLVSQFALVYYSPLNSSLFIPAYGAEIPPQTFFLEIPHWAGPGMPLLGLWLVVGTLHFRWPWPLTWLLWLSPVIVAGFYILFLVIFSIQLPVTIPVLWIYGTALLAAVIVWGGPSRRRTIMLWSMVFVMCMGIGGSDLSRSDYGALDVPMVINFNSQILDTWEDFQTPAVFLASFFLGLPISFLILGLILQLPPRRLLSGLMLPEMRPPGGTRLSAEIRTRLAYLLQWSATPEKPPQSLMDTLLGPGMRWIIPATGAFFIAIWVLQIVLLIQSGEAFYQFAPVQATN